LRMYECVGLKRSQFDCPVYAICLKMSHTLIVPVIARMKMSVRRMRIAMIAYEYHPFSIFEVLINDSLNRLGRHSFISFRNDCK
jgi:hypothetical protein